MRFFDRFRASEADREFKAPETRAPQVERKEIKYPLTSEKLEGKLEPLESKELERAFRAFCEALPRSVVMISRKGDGPNYVWPKGEADDVRQYIEPRLRERSKSISYETFYTSKFARGFRGARRIFPEVFDDMIKDECWGGTGLLNTDGLWKFGNSDTQTEKNHSSVFIGDVWIPTAQEDPDVTAVEPWKMMVLRIFESGQQKPSLDSRLDNVNVTILLGRTNLLNQAYDFPPEEVQSWLGRKDHPQAKNIALYDMTIRALRSDPQFVVKALYDVAPEIFTTLHSDGQRGEYIPSREAIDKLTATIEVPEFNIAGITAGRK